MAAQEADAQAQAVSVLIAEDEPNIAAAVEFLLRRAGYTVRMAGDGESAWLDLLSEKPDLVVLDVMLPRVNGFEVLKRIRSTPRLAALPVLVLTAKGQQQDRQTAEAIGADAFLTKPFSNSELVACVRRLKAP
ncbi:MAG: response regulator [Neomegalonema sp.]|nr:response regulator [Neomegalonema sp.]